jgi:hypothetical protein
LNDVAKFSPVTGNWMWVGGADVAGASGSHGTLGTPSTAHVPGSRSGASTWTDAAGNFRLYAGTESPLLLNGQPVDAIDDHLRA